MNIAREKFQTYKARFFQTIALPHEILSNKTEKEIKFNQWRIDFPNNPQKEVPDKFKTIFSIIESFYFPSTRNPKVKYNIILPYSIRWLA